jgi:hypothetical protein
MSEIARLHPRPPPKRKRQRPDSWGEPLEVKSAISWRFQWHREVLKRWDLSRRTDVAVAGVLMHEFGNRNRWFAELSFNALAERAGCSRRQAIRSVIRLRDKGLLKVTNEGARDRFGHQEVNRYVLIYKDRGVP